MKKFLFYGLLGLAGVTALFLSYQLKGMIRPAALVDEPQAVIKGRIIKLDLATEIPEQIKGLSGRAELPEDRGMLFVFPEKRVRSFWMKNMNFPIDIIWLDGNRVVNISENLPPAGQQPEITYSSIVPVNRVLEINAGLAEEYGLAIGDELELNL